MPPAIHTVLGPLAPDRLGVCDAHDHLFFRSRQLPGQELDDVAAAAAELRAFRAAGGAAVVQWSPYGTGRRADALPDLARGTGTHIVAATGLHQAAHYDAELLARVMPRLAEVFVTELTEAVRGTGEQPVTAGLIKVAGSFHGLDAHARHTMTAAAEAHHATGAPIAVHHELGTGVLDVLDLLCGRLEVAPGSVILGHLNRSPDEWVHREAAKSGAFLAFDGPSRANHATDWRMLDCVAALVEGGFGGQVLLGGDTTTAAARSVNGGGPGMPYLTRVLRPRLVERLGEEAAHVVFTANPARAFAW
ncbi:phosphotriesterase [Streptantibioticus parmotrematis]|uniref:phosphotriesterase family protein n=1 Tax=Streptantibioticus parmotrematis TaxID=2873249 RepID=UPI0033C4658A